MKQALLFSAFLLGFLPFLKSQEVTVSTRLNEVYSMLPLDCKNHIGRLEENSCKCNIYGNPVIIKALFNDSGKLSQIGLNLFPLDDKLSFQPEVLFFIERTFLDYLLINDMCAIKRKAKEEKIEIRLNGIPIGEKGFNSIDRILPVFSGNFTFNLIHDSLYYVAEFFQLEHSLQMKFPANNNTITGMDKKEYGEHISSLLRNFKRPTGWQPSLPDTSFLKPYKDHIRVSVGDSYFKSITSSKYYIQNSSVVEPLFSSTYPLESFINAFLIPFEDNKTITLNIEHRIYGNEVLVYTISLSDFLIFFNKDFEYYFGIEETTDNEMTGTLILFNRNLNFINLLRVKVDKISFFSNYPKVTGKFYTNIPSDNIKNLFAEFDKGYQN